MKQFRVLIFPKNGFSFYIVMCSFDKGTCRAEAQSAYPEAIIGPIEEI